MPANIDKAKIKVDYSVLTSKADMVAKSEELRALGNTFYAEMGADLDKPSKEQLEYITDLNKTAEELDEKIMMSTEMQEQTRRREEFYGKRGNPGAPGYSGGGGAGSSRLPQTIGGMFADSKEFRDFVEGRGGDFTPGSAKHISDGVSVDGMKAWDYDKAEIREKALITGASPTSAGAMVRRDYAPMVELPWPKLVMRDLITTMQTTSDLIEYPREVSRTNNAAIVREATSALDSQTAVVAGLKPESALVLEKVTAPVKTIAHMIPVTRRALSDAPQIQGIIDSFLSTGLDQALENELINGDNTEDHLMGMENTPGRGTQAFDTDVLRTTRTARTKVEQVALEIPQAYVFNPYDWMDIELTKDGTGRYYYGGPSIIGNPILWGLPVVVSPFMPRGTAYCGNFKRIVVWDREQGSIRITDAHKDWFQRNLVAVLAEERLASGNFRPIAIWQIDLTAGTPNS